MRIAPYWVSEKREIAGMLFRLQGYSFCSAEEAQARLEEKARLHAALYGSPAAISPAEYRARLRRLDEQPDTGEYSAVIAEELLEELDARNVITRNRYGAEVLNSEDTCFLDVDHFVPTGLWTRIVRCFGGGPGEEELLLEAVRRLCREEPELGVRVYRTARGWRLAAVAPGLSPGSVAMETLCSRLQVDALYCKLCMKQGCWRARLTPKPFRLRMPGKYPQPLSSSAAGGQEAQEWLALYKARAAGSAVCRLVDTVGTPVRNAIISLHDERTSALKPEFPLC